MRLPMTTFSVPRPTVHDLLILLAAVIGLLALPAPARAACQAGYAACPQSLGGGCAPIGSVCCPGATHVPAGRTCGPEAVGSYGATAAGISSRGDYVGVGFANDYGTQSAADARALAECGKQVSNCRVVRRFWNGGCGYVSHGSKSGGVCWGAAATQAEAVAECRKRGCNCATPIGGCTRRQ